MKTIFAFALLLLTPQLSFAAENNEVQLPEKSKFHLYLLVGQSNMAGRGKVAEEDKQAHPRLLTLTKEGTWKPAVDPIHFDKSVAGVCLGRTFGIEMANQDEDITIGLIPAAAGGSPIKSWEPGGYHSQTKSHPYDDALKRTQLALKQGTLKGILWHQGESDSNPGAAETYQEQLEDLIAGFRKELDIPNVPFIIGQLGQFDTRPWNDAKKKVDQAHQEVAKKVPHVAFVSSDDLTCKSDNVHFDAKSLREFGRRYAQAYLKLIKE